MSAIPAIIASTMGAAARREREAKAASAAKPLATPCDHGSHDYCAPCDDAQYAACGVSDVNGDPCANPAEAPGKPCCHCRVFAQMCKYNDDARDLAEDPRKIALKGGLRQLDDGELEHLIRHIEGGRLVLLDRDKYGHANFDGYAYCPLAIAARVPAMVQQGYLAALDEEIAEYLTVDCGFTIYNTRGIAGAFYTTNRREDLLTAAREVLAEKVSPTTVADFMRCGREAGHDALRIANDPETIAILERLRYERDHASTLAHDESVHRGDQ